MTAAGWEHEVLWRGATADDEVSGIDSRGDRNAP
jgi:hypothetical protein